MPKVPIVRWLTAVAVLLVLGHLGAFLAESWLGIPRTMNVPRQFDLNGEGNFAAWYYSVLLLGCAVLALALTLHARQKGSALTRRWGALAALFLLMAIDEAAQLHDMFTGPLRNGLGIDYGVFYFAWLLPAVGFLAGCVVYFAPLARSLSPAMATRFLTAAALYVGGAMGGEMLAGFAAAAGRQAPGYLAVITLEESLELAGILTLLATLLALLRQAQPTLTIRLVDDPAPAVRSAKGQTGPT